MANADIAGRSVRTIRTVLIEDTSIITLDVVCRHLGEHLRSEPSDLCGGCHRVSIVHACAIHGECTPHGKTARSLQWCRTCLDFGVSTV